MANEKKEDKNVDMSNKKIFERWIVQVNRNDGLSFEKLELDFHPEYKDDKNEKGEPIKVHFERFDSDKKVIRNLHEHATVLLTQEEADKLNENSHLNGIRYYERKS